MHQVSHLEIQNAESLIYNNIFLAMKCQFCQADNPEDANFCTSCGNNLKAAPEYYSESTQATNRPQYQPAEYQVVQKILAVATTYKIKDVNGREFMSARRKLLSPFNPKIEVTDGSGVPLGVIQGNFFKTTWKIMDAMGNIHAILRFPFFMFFRKTFTIETPYGLYTSGKSLAGKKFDCYTPEGEHTFNVDKKILSLRDSFKIISYGHLSPFITCMATVCIDQRFYPKN